MVDPRIKELAKNLVNYSCELKHGEKLWIDAVDIDHELVEEIIKEAYAVGAYPFVNLQSSKINRALAMQTSTLREQLACKYDLPMMDDMDAYIGIRGGNPFDMSDVSVLNKRIISKEYTYPIHYKSRVNGTKWVILRYPTSGFAQSVGMSTEKFEDFYFNVCNLNYSKMDKAMDALVNIMQNTDKVRLVSPGTDITFSIKNMPAIKCSGRRNIPDGEVYSAPIKNSVNGIISYNIPVLSDGGQKHEDIVLEFVDGKIVKATSNSKENINDVLDIDDGGRYVGEFAIGVNPYIENPLLDILFDEKIKGSIHFTPGACYEECDNGNKSALHWDLILVQTKTYGGGEIYFDDVLIRKDGMFVIDSLMGLNPENLK